MILSTGRSPPRDVLDWIKTLAKEDPESRLHVTAALERLQEVGPALRRPTADATGRGRCRNTRESRPRSSGSAGIRMLFVVAPERRATAVGSGLTPRA
ncbi:type II toxin-antitoxin system RelE/ParE family toxin [Streptomyces sp. MA15]|uniref:type II toxin-antitoxin system RelE/ParE family toxin n=1 Tax=Streptomyces sp. MA15 TaxID=3055061 RepID=UPI0025B1C82A|nr:type II toxin-antitoxin system RelE/ParE family toxin [Streptomyces sp. MA15]MDN3266196.1 type II toxin-antitoxin system RelE/ParE family toxin [Streptomyces sp. MA15]